MQSSSGHHRGARSAKSATILARWLAPIEPRAHRYWAAVAAVAVALGAQLALRPFIAPTPFLLFFGAIVFTSWFCGVGASLLAIVCSDLTALYFFLPPFESFELAGPAQAIALVAFNGVSLFIVAVGALARASFLEVRDLSSELRLGEERWRSLAEAIPQIVWTADARGAIDYVNARWLEYTGHSIEEAKRLGWPSAVHPDDVISVLERWKEATRTGQPYEVESRLKRASDSTFRWFLSRGQPLRDGSGTIVKWFGTSTDIDDQKRAADRARFLADAGRHLSSSLDYETTLQSVARAAIPQFADWAAVDLVAANGSLQRVAVYHADPEKIRLAEELFRRSPPKPDDPIGVSSVLRTGKAELLSEIPDELLARAVPDPQLLRIVRGLGLQSSLVAPIVARGKALGAVSFATAESGRRYTDDDLALAEELGRRAGVALDNARLYRDAQLASRLKDEFLSTLSHELRTPLTAILGWSHVLTSSTPAPERVQRALQVIERNARAQAQLIDDLLDVSRIVTGKMRLSVRSFSPLHVVEAAIESIRPSAEAKGIRLQPVLDPAAGPILGDPGRLQQIVWNLLSNAVKFTPKDGRVQVRLARIDSHVEIEVSDSGPGIAADILPHLFERFVQGDASVSRTHGGLGLGLSIARQLTELHGGTIEARSAGPGMGATFTVKLPTATTRADLDDDAHRSAMASRDSRIAPPPAGSLQGSTILVVEDAADARELVAEVFEAAGARVITAGSAAEALRALERDSPDLLVSDIGMPGADGYALIHEVRRRGKELAAIALTAYARAEDRARALQEGFDLHIPKPIDPAELVVVGSALLRRRARAQT